MTHDLWLKTHIEIKGRYMHATTAMMGGGNARMFEMRLDLLPIYKRVKALHAELHREAIAGCVGCTQIGFDFGYSKLKKAVKSIGRSKIVRTVAKTAPKILNTGKKILRSKYTAAGMTAFAAAFPPVGGPTLAAYASANAALEAVDKGNKVVGKIKQLKGASSFLSRFKASAKGKTRGQVKAMLNARAGGSMVAQARSLPIRHGGPPTSLTRASEAKARAIAAARARAIAAARSGGAAAARAAAARAAAASAAAAAAARSRVPYGASYGPSVRSQVAAGIKARRTLKIIERKPQMRAQLNTINARATKARGVIENVASAARYETDPAKRAQAQKAAQVLNIVANARSRIAALKAKETGNLPKRGILITKTGPIPGLYRKAGGNLGNDPDVLMLPGGKELGRYEKVGGCIGCGIFNL